VNIFRSGPKILSKKLTADFKKPVAGYPLMPSPRLNAEKTQLHYMEISRANEKFLRGMIIGDQQVSVFLDKALNGNNASYFMLYHNIQEEKGQVADGIGCIFPHDNTTYVFPHLFPGSPIKEFYLESLFFGKYPQKIVTWPKIVNLDTRVHGAIYNDKEIGALPVPEDLLKEVWPFPLPGQEFGRPFILKTKSAPTIKESIKLFSDAMKSDNSFRLKVRSMFLHTLGESVMMGAIFYFVLERLQSLSMLAPLMLIERFMPLLTTPINSQNSEKLDDISEKERLIKKMNSEVPFMDMWVKYHTMNDLIDQNKRTVMAKTMSSSLFFGVYMALSSGIPELRSALNNSAIFVAYLSSLALDCVAYTVEDKNSLAMTKTLFNDTKYENKFWQIYSIYQNYSTALQILPFLVSYGVCHFSGGTNVTMTALAATGFALSLSNVLFPMFARERSGIFLRGGYNIISDDQMELTSGIRIRRVDKQKLRLIKKDGGVFLPDIDPAKMRIVVKEEPKVASIKAHRLKRLLTFGIMKKRSITLKSGEEPIKFILFNGRKVNLAELFELQPPPERPSNEMAKEKDLKNAE